MQIIHCLLNSFDDHEFFFANLYALDRVTVFVVYSLQMVMWALSNYTIHDLL